MLALDFQLLLEAGQLAFDIDQLGPVRLQFRVFTELGVQGGLRRRIGFALALEHGEVQGAGQQCRYAQTTAAHCLMPDISLKFAIVFRLPRTSPFRRSG